MEAYCASMGIDHGGGGDKSPRIWNGETLMQIAPLPQDFVIYVGYKKSILWPSKYAKIRFRPWLVPQTQLGELTTLPQKQDIVGRLGRGHLFHTLPHSAPTRLGARHASPRIPARSTPMTTSSQTIISVNYYIIFNVFYVILFRSAPLSSSECNI